MSRAVVVVSGGDAVSPFTTPTHVCTTGLAAGNTNTYIRERLLSAGHAVYTAPAMNARSVVQDADPASFGAFGGQPIVLPADLTMVSNGPIDAAGAALARFVAYLAETEGVTEVDWVGHSNGGLFLTSAMRVLRDTGSGVVSRSVTTLGTPWSGSVVIRWALGELARDTALGDTSALAIVDAMARHLVTGDDGLAACDTHAFMLGSDGWLARQAGVLDDVDVLLVAGTALKQDSGDPTVWPFDGLVEEHSALARDVPASVIPHRSGRSFDLFHSIFVADGFGQPWDHALTWNPDVLDLVLDHIA